MDGNSISLGYECCWCPGALFQASVIGKEGNGIYDGTALSFKKCDADICKAFDSEMKEAADNSDKDMTYDLLDGNSISLGYERGWCPGALFQGNGIYDGTAQSFKKCGAEHQRACDRRLCGPHA